jgi:hypothetical protein
VTVEEPPGTGEAVRVTACPAVEGLGLDVSVVVPGGFTVSLTVLEVLVLKLESPR